MDSFMAGGFGVVVVLFFFVLAVLWFLLPFAVFGIKGLAKSLIAEQQITNKLLSDLNDKLEATRKVSL